MKADENVMDDREWNVYLVKKAGGSINAPGLV